jgi:hypothetical protein
MARGRISFKPSQKVRKALDKMAADGRKVRVVGRVKAGLVEIDSKEIAAFVKKYPRANISFVALNAPFKTRALSNSP